MGAHNVVCTHFRLMPKKIKSTSNVSQKLLKCEKMREHCKTVKYLRLPGVDPDSDNARILGAVRLSGLSIHPRDALQDGLKNRGLDYTYFEEVHFRFLSESGESCLVQVGLDGVKSCPRPVLVTRAWQLFSHSDQVLKALRGRTDSHKEVTSYGSCSLKAPRPNCPAEHHLGLVGKP